MDAPTAHFDTLDAAHKLETSGIAREHAEAIVSITRDATDNSHRNLATQADIEKLQTTTQASIERLQTTTQADIERLQTTTQASIEKLQTTTQASIEKLQTNIEKLETTTKADIEKLQTNIEKLEITTKADIEKLRADLYRALLIQGGAVIAIIGTMIAIASGASKLFTG